MPTHTVAATQELYQLMLPTKLYHQRKTGKGSSFEKELQMSCTECVVNRPKVCRTYRWGVGHSLRLSISRGITQLLKLFFGMLKDLELISEAPPWYSKIQPKPSYENGSVQASWDVPVYADSAEVRATKIIDARIIDKEQKRAIEMSCPWLDNREEKEIKKTQKYGSLTWELRERFPGYQVKQYNILLMFWEDIQLM